MSPSRVPDDGWPPPGGGKPANAVPATKSNKALAILGTRQGQVGAGAGVVLAIALYRRAKNKGSDPATAAATTTSGTGVQGTADTTNSDLYNTLEPLIEKASGFTDASSIEAQLAAQTAAISQLGKTSTTPTTGTGTGTTSNGTGTTPAGTSTSGSGHTYQAKEVATGPQTVLAFFKKIYPTANNTELQKLLVDTERDPRNASNVAALKAGKFGPGAHKVYVPAIKTAK